MNAVVVGYLKLARLANLPTAAADIVAGMAIAGLYTATEQFTIFTIIGIPQIVALIGASVFLYAGGVALNDVFDLKIDTVERPERPIPSGLISLRAAAIYGVLLLLIGIGLAFFVGLYSGCIALVLAICILLYDAFSKQYSFLGPLNMAVCRAINLILGMSVLGYVTHWYYAILPLIYIFAITLISRGEVHGKNTKHIIWAGILYALVIFGVIGMVYNKTNTLWETVCFTVLFAFLIYRPLIKAYKENTPLHIKKAVIAGVLSIIVLDAALAVGFSVWWYGLLILALLPLSKALSKLFVVT